jgi:UDP-2-acetamido-2,6-beta-L-arabino-hexul-4-ose reductase
VAGSLRILVTGARGFIGRNLIVRLGELAGFSASEFVRGDDAGCLPDLVAQADAVVHLAGENRPAEESAFDEVNAGLSRALCDALGNEAAATGRKVPLILTSSTQAGQDNAYGRSKLAAENAVRALSEDTGNPVTIFRLPGVFGKWCRPNYNSVVATFCHNIARSLPIRIDDSQHSLQLVYVDDVVSAIIAALENPPAGCVRGSVEPQYTIEVGALAERIRSFEEMRRTLGVERVGEGLTRALYATYVSFLPTERFSYEVVQHKDSRGEFVEMLKTPDSGQVSFFTAHPGVTRGGHYHHTKVEKFLVIRGRARFRFRHLLTGERVELETSGECSQIVETIPGWSHDITNVGEEEMFVMLWANEIFDRDRPDTIASKV